MSNYINTNFYNSYGLFNSSSSSNSLFQSSNSLNSSSSSLNIYDLISKNYGQNIAKGSSYATSSEVRSSGNAIADVLKNLTTKGTKSLFNQTSGASSKDTVATVTVDNSKVTDKTKLKPFDVSVEQLATKQSNVGSLNATGKSVNSGLYKFEIDYGGKKQQFSVNVSLTDNNESIQKKMATAINDSKIGINASVSKDSKTGVSSINISTAATGTKDGNGTVFTIKDTSGNLVSTMGADKVSQEAQNAIYAIGDGTKQYSTTNNIDLGNGTKLNLTGAGTASVSYKQDGTAAIDKVKELVNFLNEAYTYAAENEGRGSTRLLNDIYNMNTAYGKSLERIGITSNSGVLSIDSDKLKAAAENGELSRMFEKDGNMGFAARASRIASNMSSSQYYADSTQASGSYSSYNKYASQLSLFESYF